MNVGIYARVSTDEQNIHQQIDVLKKFVKSKGWHYRTYSDEAMSGSISDRPEWNKLLKYCMNDGCKKIVVVRSDRITRDLKYSLEFLDFLNKNKVELLSLHDGINIKPLEQAESLSELFTLVDNIFRFKLYCLLSERELIVLDQRRKIGIERAKEEGKYKGGKKGRTWSKKN